MATPNYKESTIAGTKWQRCNRIVIENGLDTIPYVNFQEEVVFHTGFEQLKQPCGVITIPFNDETASMVFDLINPQTGDVIGQATGLQTYIMLFSLYLKVATDRDVANTPPPEPAPLPEDPDLEV